jgi:hypothetical protein
MMVSAPSPINTLVRGVSALVLGAALAGAVATPSRASGVHATSTVRMYLIALNDHGRSGKQVGCGDSLVPVVAAVAPATHTPLRSALRALLQVHTRFYGQSGLYTALSAATLSIGRVTIMHGHASVYLHGRLNLAGECDNPRVRAQLTATVMQFPSVHSATIYINGMKLSKALSLKG